MIKNRFNPSHTLWGRLFLILALAACYYYLVPATAGFFPFREPPNWFKQLSMFNDYPHMLNDGKDQWRYQAMIWGVLRRAVISLLIALPIGLVIKTAFKSRHIITAFIIGAMVVLYGHFFMFYQLHKAGYENSIVEYVKSIFNRPEHIPGELMLFTYIVSIGAIPLMTWISGTLLRKKNGTTNDEKIIHETKKIKCTYNRVRDGN